jgi:DeoR family transcriptional regulator of aga operon
MRYDRLNALLEVLANHGHTSVEELADRLGVSTATIRRDLDHLASQQMVTRTRGGAVANSVADLPIRYKTARHASAKQRIGQMAAELIRPGMVIGINGGTTTSEVARALAHQAGQMYDADNPRITLVTNAVNIANELIVRGHLKIVVTGGVARPQSYELIGPMAHPIIEQVSLDLAFLGVDGLNPENGATTPDENEASINRLLASRAKKVVVVADGSKVGNTAFARICSAEDVDVLVTDNSADPEVVAELQALGLEVLQS